MRDALRERRDLHPGQVDHINAHGSSTPLNDVTETAAIKSVFGAHAYHIPVCGTKGLYGHPLGAAGAVEAVLCALTFQHDMLPPTVNLEHPDPECDFDYVCALAPVTCPPSFPTPSASAASTHAGLRPASGLDNGKPLGGK